LGLRIQLLFSMQNIERKILGTVRETIAAYRMFSEGDAVLAAVSGGADSITLAHVLHILAAEYSLRLGIAHLNHCLRGEAADRDADFVADFAAGLNLRCFIEKKDVPALRRTGHLSLEEAARKARYDFYHRIAAAHGFNKVALGHHSNDNAELLLLNLLRGSGPLGLSGIPPVRAGKIVRPLVRLKRSEIIAYAAEKKLAYVTDASNADLAFRRNRIRHQLIPELANNYNPRIVDTLNRLAVILRDEEQWIEDSLEPAYQQCVTAKGAASVTLDLAGLDKLAVAVRRRLLRKAIFAVKQNRRRIGLLHIDAILDLTANGPVNGRLSLPERIQVQRDAAVLTITKISREKFARVGKIDKRAAPHPIAYQYSISSPGTTITITEADVSVKLVEIKPDELPDFQNVGRNSAFFDLDCLQFPLVIRSNQPGDRFSPLGINGTQTIKKYFSNHKIPAGRRHRYPVLLSGDKIIWLAGQRIDNCVKIGARTRRILKAELLLA